MAPTTVVEASPSFLYCFDKSAMSLASGPVVVVVVVQGAVRLGVNKALAGCYGMSQRMCHEGIVV